MPGFGSVSPVRGNQEQLRISAQFTGAGAADCVAVSGMTRDVKSLTYNSSTGKFILTLWDWPGVLVDVRATNNLATGNAPLVGNPVWASIDKDAKTIPIEFWDLATPSLTNPVASTVVTVELTFQKTV
jgi:hypothetical protein